MISNNYKTSLQVAKQLPEFIQNDSSYQNFVAFIEAYYQWMEASYSANASNTIVTSTGQGVTHASKNLLSYTDVDNTLDEFVDYFINDFLPYIPKEALTDKRKLLKISKELYNTKGTENSYKFLFRALYNSSAEIFNTSDTVLKASDGKWVITKSLRIDSLNPSWLLINNLRLFGETTKSYATIDYSSVTGSKTEVFISNIQRLFNSGEFVRVVDNNNLDVYFLNDKVYIQNQGVTIPSNATVLRGKIIGVISSIRISSKDRGQFYESGDPVIVSGGLNTDVENPIGAEALVGQTTKGSIATIVVTNGSNGYRLSPNSTVVFTGAADAPARAEINLLDNENLSNIFYIANNSIGIAENVVIGNATSAQTYSIFANPGVTNTNSKLIDAFTFTSLIVGPIGSVRIVNQGAGYTKTPDVSALSLYTTDVGQSDLRNLGILQPIKIVNGGTGYGNNDTISIVGGIGEGAFANIIVDASGTIVKVPYVFSNGNTEVTYPLGGCGFTAKDLPKVIINSDYGENAELIIPGIMGDGAILSPTTDRIGQISTINIVNPGEDYVDAPKVYLNVQDLALSNVSGSNSIVPGDIIYQGNTYLSSTYSSNVYSFTRTSFDVTGNTQNDIYRLRVYDYSGSFTEGVDLKVDREVGNTTTQLSFTPQPVLINKAGASASIIQYGDGNAKANASFLNGLIVGQGLYLNEDGQPSSLGLVLQSLDYNKYTYVLSVEKALKSYKDLILNLLHPSGSKLIGRNLLRTSNSFSLGTDTGLKKGYTLEYVAGGAAYLTLEVDTSSNTRSTNIIKVNNVIAGNIGNTIFANDYIKIDASNNVKVYSLITDVNYVDNELTLSDNVFLTFANVGFGYANASSNVINITSVTGQYDGNFGNLKKKTPANNIIYVGDQVSLNGGPYYKVTKVFANGNISVANSSFGPTGNSRITVNKNANTQTAMIYGQVFVYDYPLLATENGNNIITEEGKYLIIG
ncbi:hypothetical protein EBU71_00720 [bacterium]|nr:hypothetical protein [Candidatus Elulimicrobium humile]